MHEKRGLPAPDVRLREQRGEGHAERERQPGHGRGQGERPHQESPGRRRGECGARMREPLHASQRQLQRGQDER